MKKSLIALTALGLMFGATPANAVSASWGLDAIQVPAGVSGTGVRVYVLDTGVASDPGFSGRLSGDMSDCNGHGTHVAGIIGSTQFGVARSAQIVSVKVADCGGGVNPATVVSAINWIIKNHPRGVPGVVNMSLAVNKNPALDAAVVSLYSAGLVPVVAAGNLSSDACSYSPAGVSQAITVGGLNLNGMKTIDSDFGSCVDVWAPGGLITSEDAFNPTGSAIKTGTSMAAGFVSGIAALYLERNPKATPAQVNSALVGGVVNGMINAGFVSKAVEVKPTGLSVTGGVLSWSGNSSSYTIQRSKDGVTWTVLVVTPNKFANITGVGYYRVVVGAGNSSVIKIG
jgi:subtilisin family serine protease